MKIRVSLTYFVNDCSFYGYVYDFFVDYANINISDVTNIHKYLMKKTILYKYLDPLGKRLLFRCWYCYLLDHWVPLKLRNVYL